MSSGRLLSLGVMLLIAVISSLSMYAGLGADQVRSAEFNSALPPTPTFVSPDTNAYMGVGNAEISLGKKLEPALIRIWNEGDWFMIDGLDSNGKTVSFLSSSLKPHYGAYVLNIFRQKKVSSLKILADGRWRIEVSSLKNAPIVEAGNAISADWSEVFWISATSASTVLVKNHQAQSRLEVNAYDTRQISLVSTESRLAAVVEVTQTELLVEVIAKGPWSIEVNDGGIFDSEGD